MFVCHVLYEVINNKWMLSTTPRAGASISKLSRDFSWIPQALLIIRTIRTFFKAWVVSYCWVSMMYRHWYDCFTRLQLWFSFNSRKLPEGMQALWNLHWGGLRPLLWGEVLPAVRGDHTSWTQPEIFGGSCSSGTKRKGDPKPESCYHTERHRPAGTSNLINCF